MVLHKLVDSERWSKRPVRESKPVPIRVRDLTSLFSAGAIPNSPSRTGARHVLCLLILGIWGLVRRLSLFQPLLTCIDNMPLYVTPHISLRQAIIPHALLTNKQSPARKEGRVADETIAALMQLTFNAVMECLQFCQHRSCQGGRGRCGCQGSCR
jgi:hypothetical protein